MKCKKCNSENIIIKQANTMTGAYCSDCGAWIKWLKGNELNEFYKNELSKPENREKVSRNFFKQKGMTIIKCGNCKCQLFHSNAPEPIGQFNLINANFCPQCGAELI